MGKLSDEQLLALGRFVVEHGEHIILALGAYVDAMSALPDAPNAKSPQAVLDEFIQLLHISDPGAFAASLEDTLRGKN